MHTTRVCPTTKERRGRIALHVAGPSLRFEPESVVAPIVVATEASAAAVAVPGTASTLSPSSTSTSNGDNGASRSKKNSVISQSS